MILCQGAAPCLNTDLPSRISASMITLMIGANPATTCSEAGRWTISPSDASTAGPRAHTGTYRDQVLLVATRPVALRPRIVPAAAAGRLLHAASGTLGGSRSPSRGWHGFRASPGGSGHLPADRPQHRT